MTPNLIFHNDLHQALLVRFMAFITTATSMLLPMNTPSALQDPF